MSENKAPTEFKDSNPYPIVKSEVCFIWDCPECHEVNHIHNYSHLIQHGVDECRRCERAVNVMTPPTRADE